MGERVITVEGFLARFLSQHKERPDRPFCFILGAGASVQSGIPAGDALARQWLEDMHKAEDFAESSLEDWATADRLGVPGFSLSRVASFYPEIYERRFKERVQDGYAFLEREMDGKEPSLGYAVLAYLMSETPHRIAITTNFDNLMGDALSIHSKHFPLVIDHERLADFASVTPRRPLVAKIHGTVGFEPKSTPSETRELCDAWRPPLQGILSRYSPIVIGYAGNDGSLMGFLEGLPEGVLENVYWLVRSDEKEPHKIWSSVSDRIRDFVEETHGQIVPIPGFDEIMLLIYRHLSKSSEPSEFPDLFDRLKQRDARREEYFDKQVQEITKRLHPSVSSGVQPAAGSTAQTAAKMGDIAGLLKDAAVGLTARRAEKPWWKWVAEADSATGTDQKQAIYQKALEELPGNAPLLSTYGIFLSEQRKDYDAAEAMFKQALEVDRNNADTLTSYAVFLTRERKDCDAAEAMFKRAVDAGPTDANTLGNYAFFLTKDRKDHDAAEAMFKRAVDADPNDTNNLGRYAVFLSDQRKDCDAADAMYKRALEVDPDDARNLGNYAAFLCDQRKDYVAAEAMFKQAVDADPTDANLLVNYAIFLTKDLKDYDAAEAMFKRAVDADPNDARSLGDYAVFLSDQRKDYDAADAMYKRALEVDPDDARNLGNYALFLIDQRKDYNAAEAIFKQALEANPSDATNLGRYAIFLSDQRKDYNAAEAIFKQALEADPTDATNLGNYAVFMTKSRKDLTTAEAMFKRALKVNPNDANNLGRYAVFLSDQRKDQVAADAMYRRAVDANPNDANNLGRYAVFLSVQRKDYDDAEAMYKRAVDTDPNDANNLSNYAGFLFGLGLFPKGVEYLRRAELVEEKPLALEAELLFYRVAHDPDSWPKVLAKLRKVVEAGARSPGWSFEANIARAKENGHPNLPLLQVLAKVITEAADPSQLSEFSEWREAGSSSPPPQSAGRPRP